MTPEPAVERFLARAVERLRSEAKAERIVLFGSHATGGAAAGSDVDLLVVVRTSERPLERRLRLRRLIAGPRQEFPFDLVVLTPEELKERLRVKDQFIEDILKSGRVLHAA